MKICAISDTHTKHSELNIPECDVLVHSGDFSFYGEFFEVRDFYEWLKDQPARHKVVIAGNHELGFDPTTCKYNPSSRAILKDSPDESIHYLENSSVVIDGVKFAGTPWTPFFCDWAFNGVRDIDAPGRGKPLLTDIYRGIPNDTDILICHGPAKNILDKTARGDRAGSVEILRTIDRVRPDVYICGHIHEARGVEFYNDTIMVNASSVNKKYEIVFEPIIINLDNDKHTVYMDGKKL